MSLKICYRRLTEEDTATDLGPLRVYNETREFPHAYYECVPTGKRYWIVKADVQRFEDMDDTQLFEDFKRYFKYRIDTSKSILQNKYQLEENDLDEFYKLHENDRRDKEKDNEVEERLKQIEGNDNDITDFIIIQTFYNETLSSLQNDFKTTINNMEQDETVDKAVSEIILEYMAERNNKNIFVPRAETEEKRAAVAAAQAEYDAAKNEYDAVKADASTTETSADASTTETTITQKLIKKLKEKPKLVKVSEAEKKVSEAEKEYNGIINEFERIHAENVSVTNKRNDLLEKKEQAQIQLETAKEMFVEAEKILEKKRQEAANIEREYEEAKINAETSFNDEVDEQLNEFKKQLETKHKVALYNKKVADHSVTELNTRYNNAKELVDEKQQLLKDADTRFNETETNFNSISSKQAQVEAKKEEATQELNQAKTELNQAKTELNQAKTELNQAKIKTVANDVAAAVRLNELQKKLNAAKAALKSVVTTKKYIYYYDTTINELVEITTKIARLSMELKELLTIIQNRGRPAAA